VATVLLPRSLLALFLGVDRRHEVAGETVGAVIVALDLTVPGLRDRLVESGPRLRPHINVFVDGSPAELATPVALASVIHVIPAVSGGAPTTRRQPAAPRFSRAVRGSTRMGRTAPFAPRSGPGRGT
jgi:molybdopterin converting factor small subunit